jgi:peptidoglycan/LPS O-acetylase OafA/YrhL
MGRSIGDAIDPRNNSLNFLRLLLASMVLFSHAYEVGLFGVNDTLNFTTAGTIAVYGFFGLSGYLIAGSALRNRPGRYLWQRFLRIFPGFWVCLLLTTFLFGTIGWISLHHGIAGYFSQPKNSPYGYDFNNWFLDMRQQMIGNIVYNGSLWTLFYEFLCYLTLLVLGMIGFLRHRVLTLIAAAVVWSLNIWISYTPTLARHFSIFSHWQLMEFLKVSSIFLVGAVIYLYRGSIPDSGYLALALGLLFFASLFLRGDGLYTAFYFTPSQVGAPLIAYPLLWLGAHLPFQRIGAENDYSYGVYIYAYPATILLRTWGATRLGYIPFAFLCVLVTIPLAFGSWWLVEKRAMKLRTVTWRDVQKKVFSSIPRRRADT